MGPRLLIKFLQDAAGKGDLDPWDIDVISVIDSFLEQYVNNLQNEKIILIHIKKIYLRQVKHFLLLQYWLI